MPNYKIIQTNFKIQTLFCSHGPMVSKKVFHNPVGQKLREEINFLETCCFGPKMYPGGRLIWDPCPKIIYPELYCSWKFHQAPFILSKVIKLQQADRHKQALPSIYVWVKCFMPLYISSFTTFALLTPIMNVD